MFVTQAKMMGMMAVVKGSSTVAGLKEMFTTSKTRYVMVYGQGTPCVETQQRVETHVVERSFRRARLNFCLGWSKHCRFRSYN